MKKLIHMANQKILIIDDNPDIMVFLDFSNDEVLDLNGDGFVILD